LSSKDELSRLVLSVCQKIPHGVLVFLPSYSVLEKVWSLDGKTGIWQHLSKIYKTIVCESRDSRVFEDTLKNFYSAIEDSENRKVSRFLLVISFLFCYFPQ
jgi:Fanconi anemia group J protein